MLIRSTILYINVFYTFEKVAIHLKNLNSPSCGIDMTYILYGMINPFILSEHPLNAHKITF